MVLVNKRICVLKIERVIKKEPEMSYSSEHDRYSRFCQADILQKSVSMLTGIVEGIASDQETNQAEIELLNEWMYIHRPYERNHPFNEFYPLLNQVLEDGKLDESERADILWLGQ